MDEILKIISAISGAIVGVLVERLLKKLFPDSPNGTRYLVSLIIGIIFFALLPSVAQKSCCPPKTSLKILGPGSNPATFLIVGAENGTQNYEPGKTLVVYDEFVAGSKEPIALLQVISNTGQNLIAQLVFIHPSRPLIKVGLEVDDQVDELLISTFFVPAFKDSVGFTRNEGQVQLTPNASLDVGMYLQALEPQIDNEIIRDYLPFTPPIIMKIQSIGEQGVYARVELIAGNWPQKGTLVVPYSIPVVPYSIPIVPPTPTSAPTSIITVIAVTPTITSIVLSATPTPTNTISIVYVVTENDNLSDIALKYGVRVSDLIIYNNFINADLLTIGQQIRIPALDQISELPLPIVSVSENQVALRNGPGRSYEEIDWLVRGETAFATGETNGWYHICYGSLGESEAWIANDLVRFVDIIPPDISLYVDTCPPIQYK